MAYCVNCGVELEKSQQHCPLCGVEAVNPKEPYDPTLPRPYSTHIAKIQAQVERRYAALTVTILMALAAAVCVTANVVYEGSFTWSIYVVASLSLLWVLVLFPLLFAGLHPVAAVMLDICALLLYLYIVNQTSGGADWYSRLAMPQVLFYGIIALIDVLFWRSSHIRGWQRYGIAVMSAGLAMMGLETLLDLFNDMQVRLLWSWFVVIPAFALGLIFFLLEKKREVKDEILKRLRV